MSPTTQLASSHLDYRQRLEAIEPLLAEFLSTALPLSQARPGRLEGTIDHHIAKALQARHGAGPWWLDTGVHIRAAARAVEALIRNQAEVPASMVALRSLLTSYDGIIALHEDMSAAARGFGGPQLPHSAEKYDMAARAFLKDQGFQVLATRWGPGPFGWVYRAVPPPGVNALEAQATRARAQAEHKHADGEILVFHPEPHLVVRVEVASPLSEDRPRGAYRLLAFPPSDTCSVDEFVGDLPPPDLGRPVLVSEYWRPAGAKATARQRAVASAVCAALREAGLVPRYWELPAYDRPIIRLEAPDPFPPEGHLELAHPHLVVEFRRVVVEASEHPSAPADEDIPPPLWAGEPSR